VPGGAPGTAPASGWGAAKAGPTPEDLAELQKLLGKG